MPSPEFLPPLFKGRIENPTAFESEFQEELSQLTSLKRDGYFLGLTAFGDGVVEEMNGLGAFDNVLDHKRSWQVVRALNLFDFSGVDEKTEQEKEEFVTLLQLASTKQNMARKITLDLIEQDHFLGLERHELAMTKATLKLASAMDEIYMKWRWETFNSPIGRKLQKLGPDRAKALLKEKDLDNPYSILKGESIETACQVPYAVAYSEEHTFIADVLGELINELEEMGEIPQAVPLITYFSAYQKALTNTNLAEADKLWATVDDAWMGIKGDFIPVHAMESFYDPRKIRIVPEFRLLTADSRHRELAAACIETKRALLDYLSERYGDLSSYQTSESAIRNSEIGFYLPAVAAGVHLDFSYAGQIVPNRREVVLKKGRKVFFDYESWIMGEEKRKKRLLKVFGEEFASVADRVDPDEFIALYITAHELSHTAFDYPADAQIRIEKLNMLSETKAALLGMSHLGARKGRGEIETDCLLRIAVGLIGYDLGILCRGQHVGQIYVGSALLELNAAFEVGLITIGNGNFHFHQEKVEDFYQALQKRCDTLVTICDQPSLEKINEFLEKYSRKTDEITTLIEKARLPEEGS